MSEKFDVIMGSCIVIVCMICCMQVFLYASIIRQTIYYISLSVVLLVTRVVLLDERINGLESDSNQTFERNNKTIDLLLPQTSMMRTGNRLIFVDASSRCKVGFRISKKKTSKNNPSRILNSSNQARRITLNSFWRETKFQNSCFF